MNAFVRDHLLRGLSTVGDGVGLGVGLGVGFGVGAGVGPAAGDGVGAAVGVRLVHFSSHRVLAVFGSGQIPLLYGFAGTPFAWSMLEK